MYGSNFWKTIFAAPGLEQRAEGCGGDPFSKAGYHAPGDEYVLDGVVAHEISSVDQR